MRKAAETWYTWLQAMYATGDMACQREVKQHLAPMLQTIHPGCYQNHAFIVAAAAGAHDMQVFDLTSLRGGGAWRNDSFFPNGIVVMTSGDEGLSVLRTGQ